MPAIQQPTIAIVGGGASGVLVAIQLLRQAAQPLTIHLIERGAAVGRGVAYSTPSAAHCLNVPAAKMSALPSDPNHFLAWLSAYDYHDEYGQSAQATSFVPRALYSDYLTDLLYDSIQQARDGVQLISHQGEVVDVEQNALENTTSLILKSGEILQAHQVVLALGNLPPKIPAFVTDTARNDPHFIANPWELDRLDAIPSRAKVLFMGAGLTMVDLVAFLKGQGHIGEILAISRRGLTPQGHHLSPAYPIEWEADSLPHSLTGLVRVIRAEIQTAQAEGWHWQAVIDSLRPLTQALWERLSLADQRRFLRHLQPYWDVARHRVAPPLAAQWGSWRASGAVTLRAGHFGCVWLSNAGHLNAEVKTSDGQIEWIQADYVVNCTGVNGDYRRQGSALIHRLLTLGLTTCHPLDLGLVVTDCGALIDQHGSDGNRLYAIGPLRKGQLWETTAIPEIRQQALALAQTLLAGELV